MLLHMTASHSPAAPPSPAFSSAAGRGHVLGSEHISNTNGGRMLLFCPSSMVAKMSGMRVSSYCTFAKEKIGKEGRRAVGKEIIRGRGKRRRGRGLDFHLTCVTNVDHICLHSRSARCACQEDRSIRISWKAFLRSAGVLFLATQTNTFGPT